MATTSLAAAQSSQKLPVPAKPSAPPQLSIAQPASGTRLVTHRVKAPRGSGYMSCLLDEKDRYIKVSAKSWNVKPGGNGVLVVVDGVFATVTHDLGKPISIADLEPFGNDATMMSGTSPMAMCGWHWIAAVPTAPNGQMLDVPPVVSWYDSTTTRSGDRNDSERPQPNWPLIVVNWPLIGEHVGGALGTIDEPVGIVMRDPKRLVFDYQVAQGEGCSADLMFRDVKYELADHGAYEPADLAPIEKEQLSYLYTCPHDDSHSYEGMWLHAKLKRPKAVAWPK
ncbi:MAG TPA: hypothetical protein VGC41_21605 [Kofleriaceae bacterium]